MTKASENVFPKIQFSEETAPATPSTGEAVVYVKTDGKIYLKDDAGTETDLTATGGGGAGTLTTARMSKSSPQSIPDNTLTIVTFSTEDWDDDGSIVDLANNQLDIQTTGKYELFSYTEWDSNATGVRFVGFYKSDGTLLYRHTSGGATNHRTELPLRSPVIELTSGDAVELRVAQTSGGALNLSATTADPLFGLVQIS